MRLISPPTDSNRDVARSDVSTILQRSWGTTRGTQIYSPKVMTRINRIGMLTWEVSVIFMPHTSTVCVCVCVLVWVSAKGREKITCKSALERVGVRDIMSLCLRERERSGGSKIRSQCQRDKKIGTPFFPKKSLFPKNFGDSFEFRSSQISETHTEDFIN